MLGISLQAEQPLASQEGVCSMNFVTEMRHPIPETSTVLVLTYLLHGAEPLLKS